MIDPVLPLLDKAAFVGQSSWVLYLERPSSCSHRGKKGLSDMDRERQIERKGWKRRAGVAAGKDY